MEEMDTSRTSSTNSENISNETAACSEKRSTRGSRQKGVDNLITKKFLRNFDPEHSEREKRKLYRRLYQSHRKYLYDENGVFIQTSNDLCDCLDLECQGCHFPCPKCSSPKCAHECRNNRKWTYDSIHCEGTDLMIKNVLMKET